MDLGRPGQLEIISQVRQADWQADIILLNWDKWKVGRLALISLSQLNYDLLSGILHLGVRGVSSLEFIIEAELSWAEPAVDVGAELDTTVQLLDMPAHNLAGMYYL